MFNNKVWLLTSGIILLLAVGSLWLKEQSPAFSPGAEKDSARESSSVSNTRFANEETGEIPNALAQVETVVEKRAMDPDVEENFRRFKEAISVDDVTEPQGITDFVSNVQGMPVIALKGVMDRLQEDRQFAAQWLDSVLDLNDEELPYNLDDILAVLDADLVTPFMQRAFSEGHQNLKQIAAQTLAKRNDIELVESGLANDLAVFANDPQTNPWTARDAIRSLGKNADANELMNVGADLSLQTLLQSDDHNLSSMAVTSMMQAGFDSSDVDATVMNLAGHPNGDARTSVLENLSWWVEHGYRPSDQTQMEIVSQVAFNPPERVLRNDQTKLRIIDELLALPLTQEQIDMIAASPLADVEELPSAMTGP